MSSSPTRPQWRRIYRQTITLIHKNLLIFWKAPISTLIRAFIFPIILTLIFCFLKYINATSSYSPETGGLASSPSQVKDLAEAINASPSRRLVFVRNGISNETLNPIIDGIIQQPGMQQLDTHAVDDPNELFDLCKQSLQGNSDCFAAVIFVSYNDTNVEYTIAFDSSIVNAYTDGDFATDDSFLANRILPLQWAVESHIGNFSSLPRPQEQPFSGYFGPQAFTPVEPPSTKGAFWLTIVAAYTAPIFILILIGVVYHLSTFVATERQSTIAELMAAQRVTAVPRILSTTLSFYLIYFPGFLVSSILLTQILFTKTSDILLLFLTLLAGGSLINTTHFVASFFGKAQLAGLYTSVLAFALALVALAASLTITNPQAQIISLSAIFPPYTWATLMRDLATAEYDLKAFSLLSAKKNETFYQGNSSPVEELVNIQSLNGYLYIVFFILQIIVYGGATYAVERGLWGVTRKFDRIDASSDVALRCNNLSKTYHAKRSWYWPFKTKGKTIVAVDNLDLEVKKGSVTFLLGPNGGGKTTTLKCVAGITGMDPGSHLELNEAGLVFGICPQTNVFWDNLTVQEHIMIWRKLKTAAFEDLTVDDDDVLVECDLLEKVKAPAKTLSGGQMRKLQLAIAFVGGSKVCCIDEASSGLDPLSRRNIWNIIQKGHTRRTILVTTHFLDEADVLADHIAIVYKGKLVCEGPGTSLKARFGDNYLIRSESEVDGDTMVWRTANSAEATRKVLELETLSEDNTYNVVFPTLEQVFLKVTSDTAIHESTGDGIVGEEETNTVIDEKIFAPEQENAGDINLDVGHSIGLARQVQTLFRKRYILLLQKSSWIAYGINLIIPVIIAAALVKFLHRMDPLQTCQTNEVILRNSSLSDSGVTYSGQSYPVLAPLAPYLNSPQIYTYGNIPSAFVGPQSAFSGPAQDELYLNAIAPIVQEGYTYGTDPSPNATSIDQFALSTRAIVNTTSDMVLGITNSSGEGYYGFGIFAPTPDAAILYHSSLSYEAGVGSTAFSLITNRISNSTTATGTARTSLMTIRSMRNISSNVNVLSMPICILLTLAFIAAASIAVIYPAFEKINRVRALHYCNGVSPFALWFAYLLFDTQLIIIQAIIVWGLLFAGPLTKLWYDPGYILGAFILFGIATYLGTYLVSLFVKKAAFAVAAGIHIVLFVLYLASYIMNQSFGNISNVEHTYTLLQDGLGLSSPGANLARALFLGSNTFEILCGKYGDADVSNGFSYDRYGGVYANLLIQIVLLIAVLTIYEYGSADWFRRNITHRGVPARLHYIVDSGDATAQPTATEMTEKNAPAAAATNNTQILTVSRVSKFFGRLFAAENISFNISSNETLALLGGNGAGKTTMINIIRGELKPDFGDIHLDGVSVLRNPHKARLHMGVCPQDDAVDNLTVRQTLDFYALVKGLKNIGANVDKVLNALNITVYEHLRVKELSGGTKRKLSVAIALLGNPRVLLLDEPSTGQDAGAKRILWKALQDISGNRAILLTTHSMEEAEALATNVAIMGTKMLATGTLASLQESHGGAFSIRAVRVPGTDAAEVETLVKEKFEGRVSNYSDSHGQVGFNLPHDKRALGSIMRVMEGLKGDVIGEDEEDNTAGAGAAAGGSSAAKIQGVRVLQDYTITGPTLEEVFMNVARESGVTGAV